MFHVAQPDQTEEIYHLTLICVSVGTARSAWRNLSPGLNLCFSWRCQIRLKKSITWPSPLWRTFSTVDCTTNVLKKSQEWVLFHLPVIVRLLKHCRSLSLSYYYETDAKTFRTEMMFAPKSVICSCLKRKKPSNNKMHRKIKLSWPLSCMKRSRNTKVIFMGQGKTCKRSGRALFSSSRLTLNLQTVKDSKIT